MIILEDNRKVQKLENAQKLLPIANQSVKELCDKSPGLFVFPHSLNELSGKFADAHILDVVQKGDDYEVSTGNVMGFFSIGDLNVKIRSRFDTANGDNFLHYMLQKVMSLNLIEDYHLSSNEDVFDFLPFLFPSHLNEALAQGYYRQYCKQECNDANVRGTIDMPRHLRSNIPFNGKIAYTNRTHAYDNDITELIRHTIECIRAKKYASSVLTQDYETRNNVAWIESVTPNYRRADRNRIIVSNLKARIHPCYFKYEPLQRICLRILRMEQLKYGENPQQIKGILFDGAWLWENNINILLKESKIDFVHPDNIRKTNRIWLFKKDEEHQPTGARFPDFYSDNKWVLDAKYKHLETKERVSNIPRDDLHQIISYMHVTDARVGGFIYPSNHSDSKDISSELNGLGGKVFAIPLSIPGNFKDYQDFCDKMKTSESDFISKIFLLLWS